MYIFSRNKSGSVSSPFFPFVVGMLVRVDKRVGFRHAIDDEQYTFSYSRSSVKHRTP